MLDREHSEITTRLSLSQRQATIQDFRHSSLTLFPAVEFEREAVWQRRYNEGREGKKAYNEAKWKKSVKNLKRLPLSLQKKVSQGKVSNPLGAMRKRLEKLEKARRGE